MEKSKRLESLDILRGADLFLLVGLEPVLKRMIDAIDQRWYERFMVNFRHVEWEGFAAWDLIMPLFLFMAGVSMPFALSRFKRSINKKAVYTRILKRVLLLWIFGMMCQGNLLGLDPDKIYLYSNTLQAIAAGYLIAALLYLHSGWKFQVSASVALLLVYWAAMEFISVQGFGGGSYTPDGNLAEWIDRVVLGRFRDAATVEAGQVVFSAGYRYTWILSSLNFGVTVLSGVFAGHILKNKKMVQGRKLFLLLAIGAGLVLTGWLWHLWLPVIKKIWTSSMVLISSGYCFLLMGLFYYLVDYRGYVRPFSWLKVYGMNSIVAYLLALCVSFSSVGRSVFWGLEQYIGPWYPALIALSNAVILYFILWMLYKRGVFLRV